MEEIKTLNLHKYGEDHPVSFELARYVENNNMYVGVLTHESGYPEPWSDLTVNLFVKCPPDCAFVDTNNNGAEIVEWLKENGLAKETGITQSSGFCTYPMVQFNMEKLLEYCDRESIQEFRENDVKPIDHHSYEGDDRSNPLSSLEQVAQVLDDKSNDMLGELDRSYDER